MAESGSANTAGPDEKSAETLSQFAARVLNQLALSAWLPSAALVLSVALILSLGHALEVKPVPRGPEQAFGEAGRAVAHVSLGGALLMLAAVVVLTVLTQAFAFEAIRTLEGYWGTRRLPEFLADKFAGHHAARRKRLDKRRRKLTKKAWQAARTKIVAKQAKMVRRNQASELRDWTPDMLTYLGANLLQQPTDVHLDQEQRLAALKIPWRRYAPPPVLRRLVNVDKARRDYPDNKRFLPTLLGNVLRHHEDQTESRQVETLVIEMYDNLPVSLQGRHNEARNRLDLYCCMVFVLIVVAMLAGVRLGPHHHWYAVGIATFYIVASWVMYRAAVASARSYGLLLLRIAKYPGVTSSK